MRRSNGGYLGDPFDFVAAYGIVEDVWYIIAAAGILRKQRVMLHPGHEGSKYGPYREAWDLLKNGTWIKQNPGIRGYRHGGVVGIFPCRLDWRFHTTFPHRCEFPTASPMIYWPPVLFQRGILPP